MSRDESASIARRAARGDRYSQPTHCGEMDRPATVRVIAIEQRLGCDIRRLGIKCQPASVLVRSDRVARVSNRPPLRRSGLFGLHGFSIESAVRPVTNRADLEIDLYADGADLDEMLAAYRSGIADGFTTNPTLMVKAGVRDYREFAREILEKIPGLPISFEVISDEFEEMGRQAREIASWGENVYVKVPISNTRGESSLPLIGDLCAEGVQVNATAVMTLEQVAGVIEAVNDETPSIVSIFAGRIADTGVDPVPIMREAVAMAARRPNLKVLWASPREVLNLYQAAECGCHSIAITPELLAKLSLRGKDLNDFSRETVQMFYDDACRAGYRL